MGSIWSVPADGRW